MDRGELRTESLQGAFEAHYATGANSATLPGFARLLERLAAGVLLSPAAGPCCSRTCARSAPATRRIAAGLPPGSEFAQTGTQLGRACNVGLPDPARAHDGATVVVACAEGCDELAQAERAFQALGRALGEPPRA